jgi:hypothetical protein
MTIHTLTTEQLRKEFEAWLREVHWLASEWQEERNCFADYPAHLAFKAWQAAKSSLSVDVKAEALERAWIEGYDRATAVAQEGDPADVKGTEGYHHFRCQDVERLMSWLEGKR